MSDTPRKDQETAQVPEQVEQSADKIGDLPDKAITDQDAQAVKGGRSDELPKESSFRVK
jgi:hypothetical protein